MFDAAAELYQNERKAEQKGFTVKRKKFESHRVTHTHTHTVTRDFTVFQSQSRRLQTNPHSQKYQPQRPKNSVSRLSCRVLSEFSHKMPIKGAADNNNKSNNKMQRQCVEADTMAISKEVFVFHFFLALCVYLAKGAGWQDVVGGEDALSLSIAVRFDLLHNEWSIATTATVVDCVVSMRANQPSRCANCRAIDQKVCNSSVVRRPDVVGRWWCLVCSFVCTILKRGKKWWSLIFFLCLSLVVAPVDWLARILLFIIELQAFVGLF